MESCGKELDQLCILASKQKGRACAGLIQQAINHKNIFVFGELYSVPSIQSLTGTEHESYLRTLELFAFETIEYYLANRTIFLELSDKQLKKLRQLSLVSYCSEKQLVSYEDIAAISGCNSVRSIEDFVIECIYLGLITGRLNNRAKQLHINYVMSRDVPLSRLPHIIDQLSAWSSKAQDTVLALENSSGVLNQSRQLGHQLQLRASAQVDTVKAHMVREVDGEGEEDSEMTGAVGSAAGTGTGGMLNMLAASAQQLLLAPRVSKRVRESKPIAGV